MTQKSLRFSVIDVETTGLSPMDDRVIECAVVELEASGAVTSEWSTLISIPGTDELGASFIHRISRSMLDRAPTFAQIAPELFDRLRGRVVVGHFLEFDAGHLNAELMRLGAELPNLQAGGFCTKELAKAHLEPGTASLAACCERAGIFAEHLHTALGDARATASLFSHLLPSIDQASMTRAQMCARLAHWPILMATQVPLRPRVVA